MNQATRKPGLIAVLVSSALIGVTATSQAQTTPTPAAGAATKIVKIGVAGPLTGGLAHFGKDNENGARLALEEINKTGLTVGGQRITLVLDSQDDAADPKTGTQVAQRLVDDGVVAVVGHYNSGVSIPASRIYSDAGIAQISPSSTNPDYTLQGFKTTFRLVATDAAQSPRLAASPMRSRIWASSVWLLWTTLRRQAKTRLTNSRSRQRPLA